MKMKYFHDCEMVTFDTVSFPFCFSRHFFFYYRLYIAKVLLYFVFGEHANRKPVDFRHFLFLHRFIQIEVVCRWVCFFVSNFCPSIHFKWLMKTKIHCILDVNTAAVWIRYALSKTKFQVVNQKPEM